MSDFYYKLLVSKVVKETPDSVSIQFKIPDNLKEMFRYKQGQYLPLRIKLNGDTIQRDYSICSSPYYNEPLTIGVRKVETGTVSKFICEKLKAGDVVESLPPRGSFHTELNKENDKTYILIAGGSGVTPLMSILKSILVAEPKSKVILYYGNKDKQSIMFRRSIDNLADIYADRFKVYYTIEYFNDDWKGMTGVINPETLSEIVNRNVTDSAKVEYFICGPAKMMQLARTTLLNLNAAKEKIHIEYFSPPDINTENLITKDTKERTVKVFLKNEEEDVNVPPGKVILEAVMNAGLDPPYSCRSGICTTCRARLLSGEVKMDEREGLSDAEIKEGFILTCQSHPLSDDVSIKYE